MIPLLWAAATAADDPAYDRLFGADPVAAEAAPVETGPAVPTWVWPASLFGLGVVAAMRLRRSALDARLGGMRVLDRQSVGDRSSLLVVEVPDGAGGKRRLLIGTGSGAPSLVADLGAVGRPAVAAPPIEAAPEMVVEPELVDDPELEAAPVDPEEEEAMQGANLAEEVLAERGMFVVPPELAEDDDDEPEEEEEEPVFVAPPIAPLPKAAPVRRPAPRYFTDDDLAPVDDFPTGSPSARVLRAESLGPQFASARR